MLAHHVLFGRQFGIGSMQRFGILRAHIGAPETISGKRIRAASNDGEVIRSLVGRRTFCASPAALPAIIAVIYSHAVIPDGPAPIAALKQSRQAR
jgi:hypothetical protein